MDRKWSHPRLQTRPLVFYCETSTQHLTNSVMMLSAYLLLVHDYSAEEALLPFEQIADLPIAEYPDATW